MKKVLTALALAASTAALAPVAQAADIYRAVSSGALQAPPNGSPGSSVTTVEIDGSLLRAEVPFRDLVGGTTEAHIHCCTTESFTGVAPVAVSFVDFPLHVTAGEYRHTFDVGDPAIYDPAFLASFGGTAAAAGSALVDAMNANQAYVNITRPSIRTARSAASWCRRLFRNRRPGGCWASAWPGWRWWRAAGRAWSGNPPPGRATCRPGRAARPCFTVPTRTACRARWC